MWSNSANIFYGRRFFICSCVQGPGSQKYFIHWQHAGNVPSFLGFPWKHCVLRKKPVCNWKGKSVFPCRGLCLLFIFFLWLIAIHASLWREMSWGIFSQKLLISAQSFICWIGKSWARCLCQKSSSFLCPRPWYFASMNMNSYCKFRARFRFYEQAWTKKLREQKHWLALTNNLLNSTVIFPLHASPISPDFLWSSIHHPIVLWFCFPPYSLMIKIQIGLELAKRNFISGE